MSEKIIICYECDGEGLIHCKELICYHKGDYDYWTKKCDKCEGSGRLFEKIETTITRVAYKQKEVKKRK